MADEYVTAEQVLTHAGVDAGGVTPTPDDVTWSEDVAAAINAELVAALDGLEPLTADETARLHRAALDDGAAAYARRRAPHGILSVGPDGQAVRLGADILIACKPILRRISPPIG